MLVVTDEIKIPDFEFEFSYARSSGPGGQNVNKVNSKVILRWNPLKSSALAIGPRSRFLSQYGNRLTSEGDLIVTSDRFRDQGRNREDCLEKLSAMIKEIALPPRARRKTKPTKGSVRRREVGKKLHGEKKKTRGRVNGND